MKVHENLNILEEEVSQGKLSPREGFERILSDMMEFPQNYGIQNYDEELRSDLILRLLQRGPDFFKRYNKSFGQFSTYFSSLVKYQMKGILHQHQINQITEKNISEISKIEYENSQLKYNNQEFSYRLTNFKPYFPVKTDKPPYRAKNTLAVNRHNAQNHKVAEKETFYGKEEEFKCSTQSKKLIPAETKYSKNSRFERTALVLALKSCYYLTDDHIDGISTLCKIPKEKLIEIVEELKESTEKRQDKIQKVQKARDRSFQLRRKIEEELANFPAEDKKQELLKNYRLHTRNWNVKNNTLKDSAYLPSPTNKKIGEVLGLCERQVGYYLQKASETVENYNKTGKLKEE